MNDLMIFEGNEVEVFEFKGEVLFNPKHVAKCLDISDVNSSIRNFNDKQVVKLTNSDVHDMHIRKLNNAGENFLKEAGVYKLIFKSHKEAAERFQDWVTDEVLPSIRKTGTYSTKDKYISEIDIAKAELSLVEVTAKLLNLNNSSKLLLATNVYENHNIPTNLLPQYTKSEGTLLPATTLLKNNNINISTQKFNKILLKQGILEVKERKSSKGKIKTFKQLVNLEYGENFVNPQNNKEVQPLYYEDKFIDLIKLVGLL